MKRDILKKLREGVKLKPEEIDVVSKEFTRAKKYGLVWEDHPEGVDLELKDGVFKIEEMKDKKISMNSNGRENLLLEGDNLHSLMALKEAGVEVDVIYIDPPYNTLNEKGFKYNDKMVDENDSYRHSKWLSFMNKRLELARDLLTDDGAIFVSIDDNELYNLKLLMDKVFGEDNFVANFIRKTSSSARMDSKFVSTETDYILCYVKKHNMAKFKGIKSSGYNKNSKKDDHFQVRGYYKENKLDRGSISYSQSLDYPIDAPDGSKIYPGGCQDKWQERQSGKHEAKDWCWRWSKEKFLWGLENDYIEFKEGKNGWTVYFKQYEKVDNNLKPISRENPIKNLITESSFFNTTGSAQSDYIGIKFSYPKPTDLVRKLIYLHPNKNATVLDFFAGSGTTGQAVMELNKEDGGNRRFILCTNNENNICEEVTYERNRRVITGEYAESQVEPLANNLSYYKVDIENIDNLNIYEKKEFDNYRNIVQILWKNDYKIVREEKGFIEVSNLDESSIIIKLDTIDESFRNGIDLNKFNKIYAKKHLSREKTFKGIDESKLMFY